MTRADRDRPWVMRTYAGHSSAAESNALYRRIGYRMVAEAREVRFDARGAA